LRAHLSFQGGDFLLDFGDLLGKGFPPGQARSDSIELLKPFL
jgi:hypothetical protein